jgi:hypothetical protein
LKQDCRVVTFDSKIHTTAQLQQMIRDEHQASGKPFTSIAFCNHGPTTSGTDSWIMTADLEVDATPDATSEGVQRLAPLVEVMIAALNQNTTGPTSPHIAFLACRLAGTDFMPDLVPALERLYQVDFMASSDDTGNAESGGDWKMETDDFTFSTVYCDFVKLAKYKETMGPGMSIRLG